MVIHFSKKYCYLIFGWMALLLGLFGIVLPILPTTPFILLSAYFFSSSSLTMHNWLLQQKRFGPIISDWQSHGVIKPKIKFIAIITLFGLYSYTQFYTDIPQWIKICIFLMNLSVAFFIYTRASSSHGHD